MIGSFRLGHDGIYRCDEFQQFIWQEHGFGTRNGHPRADIQLKQVHSDRIWNAADVRNPGQEGDALVTAECGKSIGVRTADCVPILLLDSKSRAVAAVHAGWRGTAAGVAAKTVETLHASFGSEPVDILAALGPSIRECCYEVAEDVAKRFAHLFPEWGEEDRQTRQLDLIEANRRQLTLAGVPESQIFDSGLCTVCQSAQFFSYRREPQHEGRMLASIMRLT